MKITVYAKTNISGSRCSITFEVPDEDVMGPDGHRDDAKVEELALEARSNLMEWGWFEGEDSNERDR